jgi:hypothetical protein
MKVIRAIAAVAATLAAAGFGAAEAGTYDWTISGSGYTGSGVLTTGLYGYNNPWPCATCVTVGYNITSFTGTLNGASVSLIPTEDTPEYPGPGETSNPSVGFAGNDNLIYTQAPYLDWGDIGFSANGVLYNVFNGNYTGNPGDWLPATNNDPYGIYSNPVTFTLSAVPEPAAWSMMIFGLLGLGGLLRAEARRRRALKVLAAG